jgi:uncharacterized protein
MKNLNFTLLIISCLLVNFSYSQQTNANEPSPYIEVTGIAKKEIIPDEIYIAITLKERHENKVKITIEEQEAKLKKAIIDLGLDINNLSLTDANADYIKIRWQTNDVITKKDYTLKVDNATSVGQVFQELEKIQITDAYISKVSHSQIEAFKKEVRIMAIKAAKEKADYLLEAIGEKTGKALIVTESDYHHQDNALVTSTFYKKQIYYNTSSEDVSNKEEIQFQKIIINATIYVKFSIQ